MGKKPGRMQNSAKEINQQIYKDYCEYVQYLIDGSSKEDFFLVQQHFCKPLQTLYKSSLCIF